MSTWVVNFIGIGLGLMLLAFAAFAMVIITDELRCRWFKR